ncbi:hypothetical protein HD806DRAFT_479299 [Xylariaceae sp. AK1471]|nr:hypothetical protein HD806DRAFT_479299 [Xylariaceae sp. AK1471]
MASIDGNVVRPVGSQAKFNTARHSLGILRSVIVTCRYKVSTAYLQHQSLSPQSAIENALATVIMRQPILRVGIAEEDTKEPAFVRLKTIDMRRMIEWKEFIIPTTSTFSKHTEHENASVSKSKEQEQQEEYNDRLLRSLEKYHELLWEDLARKPGWKIIVHHDPRQSSALQSRGSAEAEVGEDTLLSLDISFCFHHAYADGKSGYIFHRDLQRALNLNNNNNNNNAAPTTLSPPELQNHILHLPTTPIVLPPGMEKLIPFTLSWGFILRTIWAELLQPVLVPPFLRRLLAPSDAEIPWTGAPVDGSNPKTHIRMFDVGDEARLKLILAQCRSHKASLTGLLHALIARSLARRVGDNNPKTFRSLTPFALAGYADPEIAGEAFTPGETMHCLVTGLTCLHDLNAIRPLLDQGQDKGNGTAVWTFAQNMTARLRERAATLPRDDIAALSGLIGDWHAFFRGKFGKARDGSWELSNLGSLSAVDAGIEDDAESRKEEGWRWFIDSAVFTQGANAVGAAINVNVAGVVGCGVCATVSWQDGIVDVDLAEGLVGDLRAWVTELGETGQLGA